ncbi:uncharacterized protein LOC121258676 [Juglans microcarpa x Juglans regia]|uniref:uncharacterized protein LOC121258676 n=1 Tax=Juglans microcarpa x Juglans regia TaxID=2249226 RepID=UPI001B7EAC4A|nr:uncharacterized protein LOC121258676 [Juglans microcarpa x Juglans regia]
MTIHQYVAKFAELSRFTSYLIPDEEKKTQRFEEGLNHRIHKRVIVLQIQNFSNLVHKVMLVESNLKRSAKLQERATLHGSSSMDQGPWKKRNEGSNSGQRQMQGYQLYNPYKFYHHVHTGECRKEKGACFLCGKIGHFIRDCPLLREDNKKPNPPPGSRQMTQGNNQPRMGLARVFALTTEDAEDDNSAITGTPLLFLLKSFLF